jgi:hypothetical protein
LSLAVEAELVRRVLQTLLLAAVQVDFYCQEYR